jgi:hypothetical protein
MSMTISLNTSKKGDGLMKRIGTFLTLVCIVFVTSTLASAQTQVAASSSEVTLYAMSGSDDTRFITIKPALSVGYLLNLGNTEYTLTARGAGIGGVTKRLYDYDTSSAIYLAGRIPVTIGRRFEATLSGSWGIPAGSSDVKHEDFFGGALLGGRTWDAETSWVTGDVRLSYAIVKDFAFIKAVAPVGGLRYDYWKTTYDDPHKVSPGFAAAAPTDEANFHTSALLPYVGLTATIRGLKIGAFGGDLKLGVIGGWTVWGKVRHEEDRNGGGSVRSDEFKGDLRNSSHAFDFGEFFGSYTVWSFAPSRRIHGSLSLFGKYNLFNAKGKLDGTRTGTFSAQDTFDFKIERSSAAVGICAALAF